MVGLLFFRSTQLSIATRNLQSQHATFGRNPQLGAMCHRKRRTATVSSCGSLEQQATRGNVPQKPQNEVRPELRVGKIGKRDIRQEI